MAGSGLSIPGVTDKYGTNDLVESLMEVERIPLKREQATLETYQNQQSAWQEVNRKMSSLRESVKSLYSFENPFNSKLTSSSDENAITADANRDADFGTIKIDVIHPAAADRFMSGSISNDTDVPQGRYTFTVGEKTVDFNWKGGKLSDFVTALNKRGGNTIKASLIGISSKKKALIIESLIPGADNKLQFKNDALSFAKSIEMIADVPVEKTEFSSSLSEYKSAATKDLKSQQGMPSISKDNVRIQDGTITVLPRGGVEIPIPESVQGDRTQQIIFTFAEQETKDITEEINEGANGPKLPDAGGITFEGIFVNNNPSDSTVQTPDAAQQKAAQLKPISDDRMLFVKTKDGIEFAVDLDEFEPDAETGVRTVRINMEDYEGAVAVVVRNSNTAKTLTVSVPEATNEADALGYAPLNPIATASDAEFKYEGITLTRSTNDIDDVIPNVTLHLHDATEKTATLKIEPDVDAAKEALITFVGQYNQVIAEINILSQTKPDIINELEYLTDAEVEKANERLGMFQGDMSLTSGKSSLQRIITGSYRYSEDATVTMLSQLGISSNASGGTSGYNASQLRGYLEINEKTLDSFLANNLSEIKDLFGYDSDGDLIIDNGIGYLLDKQLSAWVQTGGILSNKISSLNTRIESSNKKISQLETQLEQKEAELKNKYATMQGTLNSLESQQTSISNWANSGNNNNR